MHALTPIGAIIALTLFLSCIAGLLRWAVQRGSRNDDELRNYLRDQVAEEMDAANEYFGDGEMPSPRAKRGRKG